MPKPKKKILYNCDECKRQFGSEGWLTRHKNEDHPYVPPPPPKKTVEVIPTRAITERHNLLDGVGIVRIGDSVNIDTKYVVRKTIVTEGRDVVEVELEKVKGEWRKK